jgi:predicted DNA-binding protein (MmcQ/YjbR family)
MELEACRKFCKSLPGATEDIKWGNDLCFSVGGKMFFVISLEAPHTFSFKVDDEDFDELSTQEGFIPAPYLARAKWVYAETPSRVKQKDGEKFILGSYELIKAKLTKKLRDSLGI